MLSNYIRYWSQWKPDEQAVVFEESSITWRDLDARSEALAAGLLKAGIGFGDRIGILMMNCPLYLEMSIAAWKVGATVVLINFRLTPKEVEYLVDDSGCKLVLADPQYKDKLSLVRDCCQILFAGEAVDGFACAGVSVPEAKVAESDVATICYTSGTTGYPKGAMLTHSSWESACFSLSKALDISCSDRIFLPAALAFTGGFVVFIWAYVNGATLILEKTLDPERAAKVIETNKVTLFTGVPTILERVLDSELFAKCDTSSWKKSMTGGSPVSLGLIERCSENGITLVQSFAQTESCGAGTMLSFNDAERKMGSAGRALVNQKVRIRTPEGEVCKPGEVGEIQLFGKNVMAGYWNDGGKTEQTLVDGGWLRTGDLGYLDEDGYLYYVDRLKDMIISGGINLYPAEIELALEDLPGVREVAVVGVPCEVWQETPLAVFTLDEGRTLEREQVLERLEERLAHFKHPHYMVIRDKPMPRGMSGTILKRELRAEYAADLSKAIRLR